ncbi:MAG: FGGY family carbohydrate kinase [Candidatus Nanopelagicus sp.]
MAILAIDQGTSSTKAILLDPEFNVITKASAALQVDHNQSGMSQAEPENMWQSVIDSIGNLQIPSGTKIDAVGLANQGESILAWDRESGEALTPIIIWQDSRSAKLCQERRNQNSFVLAKTGLTIDPYFVAPKMLWLKNQYPQLSKNAVITTTDTWLIFKLTKKFVSDKATASRSLLLDLATSSWQQQLADIWQLDINDLPELINNDQIIGPINSPEIPLLKDVPLAAAIVDQAAALFAQNCFEQGQAKCTFGTGAFLLTNIGNVAKVSKNGLATSLAWKTKSATAYYLDGQVFTAASAVDWLIQNKFLSSISEIDHLPNAQGVVASASFAGIGAPLWRPDATAAISGLGLNHDRSHIAAAIIDGIAAAIADLLSAVKSDGVKITQLRVDGGLTQSKKLMQIQADLAQIPVEVFAHPDATAIGVGYLAALAVGQVKQISDFDKYWQPAQIFTPKMSSDQAQHYLSRWRTLQRVSLDRE